MKTIIKSVVLSLFILFQVPAQAENSKIIGDYVVHFNALSTESLPPSVARAYLIKRSKNRGLLNISVLKKGGNFEGVEADVKVNATNLTGQLRNIELRKITEQKAIYYIGTFSVSNQETLDFDIQVTTPDGKSGNIKLRQQFFTN
jgi:hypothetical protein